MLKILFSTVLIAGMGLAIAWTDVSSLGSASHHHAYAARVAR